MSDGRCQVSHDGHDILTESKDPTPKFRVLKTPGFADRAQPEKSEEDVIERYGMLVCLYGAVKEGKEGKMMERRPADGNEQKYIGPARISF